MGRWRKHMRTLIVPLFIGLLVTIGGGLILEFMKIRWFVPPKTPHEQAGKSAQPSPSNPDSLVVPNSVQTPDAREMQKQSLKASHPGLVGSYAGKWDVYYEDKPIGTAEFDEAKPGSYKAEGGSPGAGADYYQVDNNGVLSFFKTGGQKVGWGLVTWDEGKERGDIFQYQVENTFHEFRRRK